MWCWFRYLLIIVLALNIKLLYADSSNMKLFPIEHYSQNVDEWLDSGLDNYDVELLDTKYQMARFNELKRNYFGLSSKDNSPWNREYVEFVFASQSESQSVFNAVWSSLNDFNNSKADKKHMVYSSNYRLYSKEWWDKIVSNANIRQFQKLIYNKKNRAIATTNLSLRGMPTADPAFYSYTIAGEGYPFDNLSLSAVYSGTPLYILGTSLDKSWKLVLSPEYIGWVRADGIAYVDDNFVHTYSSQANIALTGITTSNLSIVDEKGNYQFSGYVGMIFPMVKKDANSVKIFIPIKTISGMAAIAKATLRQQDSAILPMSSTPANFAKLFKALQGRPYAWGSSGFYTDCSAEMKSIYTMFGIFMPRNTKHQILAGKMVDISNLNSQQRLNYIIKNADPLFTIIRIKGHVFMYVGTYQRADNSLMVMTYQQMWGLSPKDRNSRAVIGQSVFLPLLLKYPEDTDLMSELDASLFQLIYLDQFPDKPLKQNISDLMY